MLNKKLTRIAFSQLGVSYHLVLETLDGKGGKRLQKPTGKVETGAWQRPYHSFPAPSPEPGGTLIVTTPAHPGRTGSNTWIL